MIQIDTSIGVSQRAVHQFEGDYYVSFNTCLPPNPPNRTSEVPYFPEHCYLIPLWFSAQHPFLPFCLMSPMFTEDIFKRLDGTFLSFPVVERVGRWSLHHILQAKWHRLEEALILVYSAVHPLTVRFTRTQGIYCCVP